MSISRSVLVAAMAVAVQFAAGCAASKVSFDDIQRPDRAAELDAYDVFVGEWDWEAETVYPEGLAETWTGTAKWDWALDKRCLKGRMSAKSEHAEFESEGVWSCHPKNGKYVWWMFNNWGYPQEGKAKYCDESKMWWMEYESVGLDGSKSHGLYTMKVVDDDTLEWTMEEWALPLHMAKKIEMEGTYRRK